LDPPRKEHDSLWQSLDHLQEHAVIVLQGLPLKGKKKKNKDKT